MSASASAATAADKAEGALGGTGAAATPTSEDTSTERLAMWLPDAVTRAGIRSRLAGVLATQVKRCSAATAGLGQPGGASEAGYGSVEGFSTEKEAYVARLRAQGIVAERSEAAANAQHYEVPTDFFKIVMGDYLKYSCCLYGPGQTAATTSLSDAERAMLDLVCVRVGLSVEGEDDKERNLTVLDLGCGWGSFTLYAAKRFPKCNFVALSNSRTQREYIEATSRADGTADRVTVVTANIATFRGDGKDTPVDADGNVLPGAEGEGIKGKKLDDAAYVPPSFLNRFDRVVSNEMFEHMKNYDLLLRKVSTWLKPNARVFVHHFSHARYAYDFEDGDWMADLFFQGGTMPSHDLMLYFQRDLKVVQHHSVSGMHYKHTCDAWLANMDRRETAAQVKQIMEQTYGAANAALWTTRWRLFFLACSELFGYNGGNEWQVTHVVFEN